MSGFTVMEWHFLSPVGLRCAGCLSEQKSLLLVSLGKGSEGGSPYGNLYPEIIFTWGKWEVLANLISRCRQGMPRVINRGTVPPFVNNIIRSIR